MSTKMVAPFERVSELLESLGCIAPHRVFLRPTPGSATEADLLAHHRRPDAFPCELIRGILVEKAVGFLEAVVATEICYELSSFVRSLDLGIVVGAGAALRILPGVVRSPDVSFIRWDKMPGRKVPRASIPALHPDLAVEVRRAGNTAGEIECKRRDYFRAGVRLLWVVDPARRSVRVCTPTGDEVTLTEADSLDGGDVLPGLVIPIAPLFATVPDAPTRRKPSPRK